MSEMSEENAVAVEVDQSSVICPSFLGFGVEWDSNGYNASGVTDADFAVIRKRVEWMRLPVARIMMQCKWCYLGDGRYDWDAPQMLALYRHLDVCQRLGTTVLLTDWGIESGWLTPPDVNRVDDPRYAAIIATYLDHLLNTKGYTCIRYFIFGNEPNQEVKDWHRWKAGVENVAAAFRDHGLAGRVKLLGSDHSGGPDWHTRAVDQLQDILGGYDVHHYTDEASVRAGAMYHWCREEWNYARAHDAQAQTKPLVVGEAGFWVEGCGSAGNPLNEEPRLGIFISDFAVQAANAGSWTVVAWMLDDNSHVGFCNGMWKNRSEGLALKPWFYPWALLCRCFRPGSRIVQVRSSDPDVRVLAAYEPEARAWSFCIVNRADAAKAVRLRVAGGSRLVLNRYVFSRTSAKTGQDGFPAALDALPCDLSAGLDLSCEANSVSILSSTAAG